MLSGVLYNLEMYYGVVFKLCAYNLISPRLLC